MSVIRRPFSDVFEQLPLRVHIRNAHLLIEQRRPQRGVSDDLQDLLDARSMARRCEDCRVLNGKKESTVNRDQIPPSKGFMHATF